VPKGVDYSQPYITPMNAKSGLPKAILVTAGFDMLRDVAHHRAQKLENHGNDITFVHYPDLSHALIQMTAHSKRCLKSTQEVACLGKVLQRRRQDRGSGKDYPGTELTSRWTTNPVLYAAIAPSHFEERLPWWRPF
jgi:acetyl esterase/lipase